MLGAGEKSFDLTNVLAQLSFTYIIAFLLMQKDIKWQLLVSFAMILLSDLLYRYWPVEGFNHPFTPDHNIGSWVDLAITGSLNSDHWVAFNAIPTTAHTIWGVIVGMLLMNEWSHIFIYLFSNLGGERLLTRMAEPFTSFIGISRSFLIIRK